MTDSVPSLNRSLLAGRTFSQLWAVAAIVACHHDPTGPGHGKVRENWYTEQSRGLVWTQPLVSGDTAFFAAGNGLVVARNALTGQPLWTSFVGQSPYSASTDIKGHNFVLKKGVLVVPVEFHTSGIDSRTGKEIWRYHAPLDTLGDYYKRPGYVVAGHVDADENTVFIPAWGASVSAVDVLTGTPRWIWRVDPATAYRSGAEGVRIAGDTLFVTVWHSLNDYGTKAEAWLLALDKGTGKELWRVVLPRQSSGVMVNSPAVWRNLVIVTITAGDMYAIDRTTQTLAWQIPMHLPADSFGFALITPAQVYGDVVFASGSDMLIRAYHAQDGSEIWATYAGQIEGEILVTEKFVYAADGASLYMIDRATGGWYAALGHPRRTYDYAYTTAPAFANGNVFITFMDGAWSFKEP